MYKLLTLIVLFFCSLYSQWTNTRIVAPVTALVADKSHLGDLRIHAGTPLGAYRSLDTGKTWIASTQITNMVRAFVCTDSLIIAGTYGGGFYTSTDGGTSWISSNTVETQNLYIGNLLFMDKVVYAGSYGSGILRSTNYGSTWTQFNTGLTNTNISSLTYHGTTIIAGTSTGVYISSDSGGHWTEAISGTKNMRIESLISCGPFDFAGTRSGVYRSSDQGKNWTIANTGITESRISAFATFLGPNNTRTIYAGTFKGKIFQSKDDGNNWVLVTDLADTLMALISLETRMFAGAQSGNVWRAVISQTGTSVHPSNGRLPDCFQLSQNYPNPFNPSTTIRYALPSSANVKLAIYDLLGREIATLVNEKQSVGWKEVEWNARQKDGGQASKVSTGVYFYKLVAGNFVDVKKMLIVK